MCCQYDHHPGICHIFYYPYLYIPLLIILSLLSDRIVHRSSVCTEYPPASRAQPVHYFFPFSLAEPGVSINTCHKDGSISVILCLLCGHALEIYIDVTGKGNTVLVVYQHYFTGKMSSQTFVYLKGKITEIKEAYLCKWS